VELLAGNDVVLAGRLAEPLAGDAVPQELMLMLFQEGEGVRMTGSGGDVLEAVVRRITLDTLEVDAFVATDSFPVGSTRVVSADGAVSARLAVSIGRGERVEALPVYGVASAARARLVPKPSAAFPDLPLKRAAAGSPPELGQRLRVGPASLPYSGAHTVSLDYGAG
jgi:hypothetical protein